MANPEHLGILKEGVAEWNRWREEHPTVRPDLSGASLGRADLIGAYLRGAGLRGADISGANLFVANVRETNLAEANLRGAFLSGAHLFGANLGGADLGGARVGFTSFANVDLSGVIGLETVKHGGPSSIGIDTIYKSKGKIPHSFLRGAGVPENFIQ